MKYAHIIVGIIFAFGMFAIIGIFNQVTGEFTYANNIGSYHAGGGWVQFTPKEACEAYGAKSFDPPRVFHNEFNAVMAECYHYNPLDENDRVNVPVIQVISVPDRPGQYSPSG